MRRMRPVGHVVAPALDPHLVRASWGTPAPGPRPRPARHRGRASPGTPSRRRRRTPDWPSRARTSSSLWPAKAQLVCCMTAISSTPRKWVASTSPRSTSGVTRAPAVAEDLGVPGYQPEHGQRLDPAVHARHQGEALGRDRWDAAQGEPFGVGVVGENEVIEHRPHGIRVPPRAGRHRGGGGPGSLAVVAGRPVGHRREPGSQCVEAEGSDTQRTWFGPGRVEPHRRPHRLQRWTRPPDGHRSRW